MRKQRSNGSFLLPCSETFKPPWSLAVTVMLYTDCLSRSNVPVTLIIPDVEPILKPGEPSREYVISIRSGSIAFTCKLQNELIRTVSNQDWLDHHEMIFADLWLTGRNGLELIDISSIDEVYLILSVTLRTTESEYFLFSTISASNGVSSKYGGSSFWSVTLTIIVATALRGGEPP